MYYGKAEEAPRSPRKDGSSDGKKKRLSFTEFLATTSHGKLRRFIIVDTRRGHSMGIPIVTYNPPAKFKPKLPTHAIAYTGQSPPLLPESWPVAPNPPIKITVTTAEEPDGLSLVDYAQTYTLEHGYDVAFVGEVSESTSENFRKSLGEERTKHPAV